VKLEGAGSKPFYIEEFMDRIYGSQHGTKLKSEKGLSELILRCSQVDSVPKVLFMKT
jgi:hypothetical protein